MTTPTPEAIEAARLALHEYFASFDISMNQSDIKAMNVALTAAAPFIAAQAKAEALREAADALELPGSTDVGYYSGYTDNGYSQAESDAEDWLRARANAIEGKSE